jgi:hypothetical protein
MRELSVGGNDSFGNLDVLSLPAASTAGALYLLRERVSRFEVTYRAALGQVLARAPRTTVCTIYGGNLAGAEGEVARVGLALRASGLCSRTAADKMQRDHGGRPEY